MTQRNIKRKSFKDRVRADSGVPILFETIPPRRDAERDKVDAWCERIVAALSELPVTAVNIPEVRDESRQGERTYSYIKRMKPREFAKRLRDRFEDMDYVVNRVVVYRPAAQQKDWLENAHRDWGIRNLILVGGESSRVTYPGPSVSGAARLIQEEVNSLLPEAERWICGGIVIASRRSSDPGRDEPTRMLTKAQAGLDFFTSQVIYEADAMCRLIHDYAELCEEKGVLPKRIFVSMAPVQSAKQIEFMRWLGVDISPGIEGELLGDPDKVGEQSLKVCERIFRQILAFNRALTHPVPLGLNISPLIRSNFDLGVELTERLAQLAGEI